MRMKIITFFIGIFLLATLTANANDKNSLLKLDLNKNSNNDVSMTVYTKNSYNEPVKILKKDENEYVMFLPQTNNAMISKPDLKGLDGVVSNVDISTYSNPSTNTGYTKIILRTNSEINFDVKSQVLPMNTPNIRLIEKDITPIINAPQKTVKKSVQKQEKSITKIIDAPKSKPIKTAVKSEGTTKKSLTLQNEITSQKSIDKSEAKITIQNDTNEVIKVLDSEPLKESKYQFEEIIPINSNNMLEINNNPLNKINPVIFLISILTPILIMGLTYAFWKIRKKIIQKKKIKKQVKTPKIIIEIDNSDGLIDEKNLKWNEKIKTIKIDEPKVSSPIKKTYTAINNEKQENIMTDIKQNIQKVFKRVPKEVQKYYKATNQIKTIDKRSVVSNPQSIQKSQQKVYPKFEKKQFSDFVMPNLLADKQIARNKGFYLIRHEEKTVLVGYINDKIFILNKYEDIIDTKIDTRLSEHHIDRDIYFVKIKDKKSLIEVKDNSMDVVLEM